ncbi:growth factor receptor-bound protein 7 isoform X1 [Xiphophorus hellerii]|uniref:growth factor receptor-bound protein 7 isoform X1 n=1 Tax=Xiphophorus hellerii TaxID=8084 RepID=UPI0013B3AC82|nr:growth factor receptor-bound protein 7-like isoform X1 [Xiphophorus hellerii]XP_032431290.1 growth factor receptor-bound protein 7-like isoform X1 [Xiphophorus hellerii]
MKDSSDEEDVSLGCSTLTLSPLVPESPPLRRSQPILISTNRKKGGEVLSSSESPIPNPFPELCNLSLPSGSLPSESSDKFVIKVYGDESAYKTILIGRQATAREVCQLLVQSAHCSNEDNWALLEIYPTLGLERCLEDHEIVLEVQATWSDKVEARFMFSKNYDKYEFFHIQWRFFANGMISDSEDAMKKTTSTVFIRELTSNVKSPQIKGFFYLKGYFKTSWKKMFFTLRRSGLYISTKQTGDQHLKEFANLNVSNVYKVVDGCKRYGAPTEFNFCIKPTKSQGQVKDLKIMCAETEEMRKMWICAFRLFKCGRQIKLNYNAVSESKLAPRTPVSPKLTESKSESENSLVAMDFTGKAGGRIIENPTEAQNAEQEEAQAWRKRETLRFCQPNTNSEPQDFSFHETHPWFYGGLTRNEAEKLIEKQGLVDGMFLMRRSQQHENCFVLSLCHELKVKHFIVIPVLEDGKKYLTLDDGKTRFIDLLQLVEFYQINKGALPVCLTRPCICVPL